MKNRKRAIRRRNRRIKMIRRLQGDRNEHYDDLSSPCWGERALSHEEPGAVCDLAALRRLVGRTFSRFADTPKDCSCGVGCGNPRRRAQRPRDRRTFQEARAEAAQQALDSY